MLNFQRITCKMKRCRVSSLGVSAINVFRIEQPLDSCQVAFLGCIEESRVASQQIGHLLVRVSDQVQRRCTISILFTYVGPMLQLFKCFKI